MTRFHPIARVAGMAALCAPAAAAQRITGRVTDAAGAPVADAQVALVELARGAVTRADGAFTFEAVPAGRYTLLVRRLGYAARSRVITVGGGELAVGDVALRDAALRAEPVTVVATRTPTSVLESPLSTAVMGEERLRREHAVAIARAADRLAGVRSVSTGQQIAKPVIRGLSGPRVVVLDNGHRVEDYSWSDEDGPSIESRLAQRIEVVRGPASLLYGSEALGGVVNAVAADLPDAVGRDPFTRYGAELYGATNNLEGGAALRAEGARGTLGWRGFLVARFAEDLHTPAGKIEHTGFGAANGEGTLGWRFARGTASLRYARYGGEFKLLEADENRVTAASAARAEEEEGPERKLSDDRVQLTANFVLPRVRLEGKAQWQRHDLIEVSDDLARFPIPNAPPPPPAGAKQEQEVFDLLLNTATVDLLAHHEAVGGVRGTLGVSALFQRNDSRGPLFLVPDADVGGVAAFAMEQAALGRLRVLAGARVDHRTVSADANTQLALASQERSWTAGSGDVGVALRVTPEVSLTANLARGWRAPTLFELYSNGPRLGEARYEIGRADLRPERATSVEGGLRWATAGGRAEGEVAAYHNRVEDFLYVAPTGESRLGLAVFRYLQAPAVLDGAEGAAGVQVAAPLTLRGRFDVVRATNRATSQPLPLIPPARVALEGELRRAHLGAFDRTYLGVEAEAVSRSSRAAPNEQRTAGYGLLNVDAGGELHAGRRALRVDLRVRNALDKSYRDFLSRYKAFALDPGRDVVIRLSTGL